MTKLGYVVVGPYGEVSVLPVIIEEKFARELVERGWAVYRAIVG